MTNRSARKAIGLMVIILLLIRGKAIIELVEANTWLGIILLLCAVSYVVWGMFWPGDTA